MTQVGVVAAAFLPAVTLRTTVDLAKADTDPVAGRWRARSRTTEFAAMRAVAQKLGITTTETVREWVRQAQVDDGQRPGTTSDELAELKRLRRENAELRRPNEILKAASAFFAAELDRRPSTDPPHSGEASDSSSGGADALKYGRLSRTRRDRRPGVGRARAGLGAPVEAWISERRSAPRQGSGCDGRGRSCRRSGARRRGRWRNRCRGGDTCGRS